MKTLLNAKRADLYLQLLSLLIPFTLAIARGAEVDLLYAYFSVGGIQVISFLVNTWWLDNRLKSHRRIIYGKWLAALSIVFLCLLLPCFAAIGIAYGALMFFAFLMLFIGAGMAYFYFCITIQELTTTGARVKRKR